ncbi:3-dehydroquinate synthase [Chryseolinea sp. H1M3-3]|uniref:3-dehydroquinate synthase n=1 Tax=Chryseolinea sp. H1M3-3 TaxID=3034144 RepID=UPI0023EB7554|nr:3-dehydroquinate synthase [Chryseolinea sp. H1M3-3]
MLPDNILLSSNLTQDLQDFLAKKQYSNMVVLVDENTKRDCYPLIQTALPPHFIIQVGSGESEKNIGTSVKIWEAMTEHALDRHACMLVLGGGVLGDMGGFCAATYKRGIDFILVPTTLLAQVDASIGGKLGIDFDHFKNHIGVFQKPALTLLFDGFLKTLPTAELRSGFAEIIKHTLISDKSMWEEVASKKITDQDWKKLIRHSVEFKAWVTTEDPKEKGLRKILNAGHTIGHALESYLLGQERRILHGEAIAVGLITEGYIAKTQGFISGDEFKEICKFILENYGKVTIANEELEAIAQLTVQDKKNRGNKILCVLLEGIGKAKWDCEISIESVKEALSFYRMLQI